MEELWKRPLTPVELHRAVSSAEPVAYTTIFTELSRLVAKGVVRKRGSEHKSVVYETVFTREQWVAKTVSNLLGDLMHAHGSAAIHGFVELVADGDGLDALNEAIERHNERKSRP